MTPALDETMDTLLEIKVRKESEEQHVSYGQSEINALVRYYRERIAKKLVALLDEDDQ